MPMPRFATDQVTGTPGGDRKRAAIASPEHSPPMMNANLHPLSQRLARQIGT